MKLRTVEREGVDRLVEEGKRNGQNGFSCKLGFKCRLAAGSGSSR